MSGTSEREEIYSRLNTVFFVVILILLSQCNGDNDSEIDQIDSNVIEINEKMDSMFVEIEKIKNDSL